MHPLLQFFKNNAVKVTGATLLIGAYEMASVYVLGGKPDPTDIVLLWGLSLLTVVGGFTQRYMELGGPIRRKPAVAKLSPPEACRK